MAEPETKSGENPEIKKKLKMSAPIRCLREAIAILAWSYSFIQLLIFDVGSFLIERLPAFDWALKFRFLILVAMTSVLWIVLGNRNFMLFVGYIIVYPFVVVCWIIPRLLFRNWAVVIAFSPAVHTILITFKSSFIFLSVALISSFAIYFAPNTSVIIICMTLLGAYLFVHYVRRFRVAFLPSTVFADISKVIRKTWNGIKNSKIAKLPEGLETGSDEYEKQFGENLFTIYLLTSCLYFVSERLREVVNSRKLDLYFLGSLLYTFLLTSLVFAFEYLGLERIAPGSFVGVVEPGFLEFLGLSFSTLMTSDISLLKPASAYAQAGLHIQLFGSLLIVVLLVFVILTSIRERYKQDMDSVIKEISTTYENLADLIKNKYKLTLSGAEAVLLVFNPTATKWFMILHYGKARANEIWESFTEDTKQTASGDAEIE